ncbi:Uracil-regulated protein 1 [Lobosporangium transversale]|uniref:GTP cyclohydrolase II, variant n=1 Tax=Lobosporangium transversale TaxID=64571 RepID=A0A1Y2H205_9FUNG|nr:GTP cyclohydrolase II, variant [Lobosporangium transversale]KAF9908071.1 Uracil-regulated protein 1 [Lobosporangium transversale]ORZ28600.1 GTP cyclohydrolase II, variant [Lobosporangium transversale]|eukprot:XP_021886273.1 GTP cyclohydrolase II, variant [Lobosporangium transversale]
MSDILSQILVAIADLKTSQQLLADKVDKMQVDAALSKNDQLLQKVAHYHNCPGQSDSDGDTVASPTLEAAPAPYADIYTEKPVLTTHTGQKGIHPTRMNWGESDPKTRGPIVVSHLANQINLRNAIGAYGGPYSVYRSLAVAMGDLPADHKPNFEHTEPPIKIKQLPQWADTTKIVSMDPFGHLTSHYYKEEIEQGLDIRPTISITRAHMIVPEIQAELARGGLKVDGKVIVNETGELNVHKAAVDPVWYLPGVAERLKVDEDHLRRSLFENTGGMYPELISRPDLKVFLPPIGGLTVYIFGNHELLSDPNTRLTVRVHDECNGSDVFGSDICTCRPYLIYGMTECIREAQNGGVGLIVYFRKEGRALGEVTKYLVYNARKRGGDSASKYFQRTQNVAGVKDMRFQALMPDVFHWLGVTKIDRFMSMSNMKHDALVDAGIKILERVPIPDEMIPPDSKVEMDAKIAAGYFTTGAIPREEDLCRTVGRGWDSFQA